MCSNGCLFLHQYEKKTGWKFFSGQAIYDFIRTHYKSSVTYLNSNIFATGIGKFIVKYLAI